MSDSAAGPRLSRVLLTIAALAAAVPAVAAAANGYGPRPAASQAQAELMRKLWASQKATSVAVVQRVYSRTVAFDLPRPFLPANQDERPGFYLAEYVPDGETVDKWTRMITVTGALGQGAAHLDDGELAAAAFDNLQCPGKVYRDLGSIAGEILGHRLVVIGCGAEGAPGSERGAIAVFRDSENVWTVQYAQRGAASAGFEARAAAEIARLAPLVTCKDDETAPACGKPAK